MAPIPIKRVVSVSSEDNLNPSSNLLTGGSGRKWLTRREEKGRRAEVVLELSKRARINSIDIGNFGSAFIEIHVCSATPTRDSTTDWLALLPSCMLMTVQDSRAGRNKTASLTCSRERFSATAVGLKWSLIKVICRQPYNTTAQFGLQYVSFYSEHADPRSPLPPHFTPSPSHNFHLQPSPSHPPHTPGSTPHRTPKHKLPSLPLATPCKQGDPNSKTHLKSKTPKRPLGEANSDECEEFSGVEKQSRLLNNALKTPRGSSHANPILDRIRSEREKVKEEKRFESSYEKKRLLVRELPKAEGKTDFAAEYGKSNGKSVEMSVAFRKMSRHDNSYEIGQEPEHPWGRGTGRRRRRSKRGEEMSEDGWVTKRKKKLSGMISECRRVLSEAGTAGGTSGRAEDLNTTAVNDDTTPIKPGQSTADTAAAGADSDTDSDATVIMDYPEEQPDSSPLTPTLLPSSSLLLLPLPPTEPLKATVASPPSLTHIQCPLCGQSFPGYAIELHAASCGETANADSLIVPVYID